MIHVGYLGFWLTKGGNLNPVQMRLPLGQPVASLISSVSSSNQFSIQSAGAANPTRADVFLPSLERQTAVAEGGTVIRGVFGHESAVAQARIPDDEEDDDPTDEGDGSNFAAPRTPRPVHPPHVGSNKDLPALPPARLPGSGDDKHSWSRFCIFIPEAELALILECLANPDAHGIATKSKLHDRLARYASLQKRDIENGTGPVAVHPKIEKRHLEIVQGVLEYLKTDPQNFRNLRRLELIRDLTQAKIDPELISVEERRDPAWRSQVLEKLNEVILAKDVMRKAVMALKIPEVLDGHKAQNPGAIFYGPPGTGKTILLRAVADVYKKCGYLAFECNVAKMAGIHVNELGHNLDNFIGEALEKARAEQKIAYIFMDEATLAVEKPSGSSVKNYYSAALDVMKKYIGNYPELVFAISTNGALEDFDDALVREMRLEPIHVPPPTIAEKVRLWKFYIGKTGVLKGLTEEQYLILAKAMPKNAQGAAVETLCDKYLGDLILKKHDRDVGHNGGSENFIEDLIMAPLPTRKDVEAEITFESFVEYVKNFDYSKSARDREEKKKRAVGFV